MNDTHNIVLIVSDTFRWDLLNRRFKVKEGVYAKTPNLDKFAEESVVFNKAYHASFPTVPNRADLLTGRYTFTYYDWSPLPRDWTVLPQLLRKAGYTSMLIADTPHILKNGYHFDRDFDGWVWIRGQENDRYRTDPIEVKLPCSPQKLRNVETTVQHMRNNALRQFEEDWIPAKTATEAMRWLERNYKRKFFLYVDFFDPHEPWDPPRWYIDMYDPGYEGEEVTYPAYGPCDYLSKAELEHIRAMYAGEATLVDKWIGKLIGKIEELGLYENTTIIFTSDHGFYLGEHGLVGKSIIMGEYHGLAPLYEEVAHIPLIIRFADKLDIGKGSIGELVQTPDITATILDLAEVKGYDLLQGRSLMPLVRKEVEAWRDFAVSTPSLIHGARAGLRITITTKEWSLILASEEGPKELEEKVYTMIVDGEPRLLRPFGRIDTELYNLKEDPHQEKNVIDEHLDVARDLHAKFISFLRELGAREEIIKPWLRCKRI
ncbi:MAG: sulfatase [Thermoprotei archaeon]|nr:sulfatase [Thermoprotei archaeon]